MSKLEYIEDQEHESPGVYVRLSVDPSDVPPGLVEAVRDVVKAVDALGAAHIESRKFGGAHER